MEGEVITIVDADGTKWGQKKGSNHHLRFGSKENHTVRPAIPCGWKISVQPQQIGENLVHVAFPFWNVRYGQNGVDAVVAA